MEARIHGALTALRDWGPLNHILTCSLRALMSATGLYPKAVTTKLRRVGAAPCKLPNGRKMLLWCHPADGISNPVYWHGWRSYEPEASDLFFRLAERSTTVIDIGAYIGFYALLAAYANPAARVYAFEPMSTAYDRLRQNALVNGLSNL